MSPGFWGPSFPCERSSNKRPCLLPKLSRKLPQAGSHIHLDTVVVLRVTFGICQSFLNSSFRNGGADMSRSTGYRLAECEINIHDHYIQAFLTTCYLGNRNRTSSKINSCERCHIIANLVRGRSVRLLLPGTFGGGGGGIQRPCHILK